MSWVRTPERTVVASGASVRTRSRDAAASRPSSQQVRQETLIEAHRNDEAAAEYETLVSTARATGISELAVRALVGAARTQMRLGELRGA